MASEHVAPQAGAVSQPTGGCPGSRMRMLREQAEKIVKIEEYDSGLYADKNYIIFADGMSQIHVYCLLYTSYFLFPFSSSISK